MKRLIYCVLPLCLLFSGCVPYHQLGERLIIQALGLDYENDAFVITAKYLGGENPDGRKGDPHESFFIAEGRGSSISHALQEAGVNAGKPLILTDCQVFIIGNSLSDRPLDELLSVILNEYEGYPNISLAVTGGSAAELIKFMYKDESFSDNKYFRILAESKMLGFAPASDLYTVKRNLSNSLGSAYLPILDIVDANSVFSEDGNYVIVNGGAVYKDGAYLTAVGQDISAGVAFIRNSEISTSITVVYKERPTLINVNSIKIKMKPDFTDGKIRLRLDYDVSASYSESRINFETDEIEKAIEEAIDERILTSLEKTVTELGVDIIGLEETVRSKCYDGWVTVSNNWENEIKNCVFEIGGTVSINKYGIRW